MRIKRVIEKTLPSEFIEFESYLFYMNPPSRAVSIIAPGLE